MRIGMSWHHLVFWLLGLVGCRVCDSATDRLGEAAAHIQATSPRSRQVTKLPGYKGNLPSKQFAGHIRVSTTHKRQLWYWLVESERSPEKDPVVLWLTGGPGCSSLDAFIYENGPFKFAFSDELRRSKEHSNHKVELSDNPYSWTKVANVIWVDSPAGTGMSFSEDPGDYSTNDTRTVRDLHSFVLELLNEYPHLGQNDFYIAGESYAGVYVPLLAKAILDGIDNGDQPEVRLKGYMVGNGVTDEEFDGNGGVEFAYGTGLIDDETMAHVEEACQGSYWNATRGSECYEALLDMEDNWGHLNPYDTAGECFRHGGENGHAAGAGELSAARKEGREWPLSGTVPQGRIGNWATRLGHVIPCADRRQALAWLNTEAVRMAIHAAPVSQLQWEPCSDVLHYDHDTGSMLPIHKELNDRGMRALVYSGVTDYVVPFTATRAWTTSLQLPVVHPWRPWTLDKQVAGFSVTYQGGLTFATVRGAGHMVPQSKPREALELFRRFLKAGFRPREHQSEDVE